MTNRFSDIGYFDRINNAIKPSDEIGDMKNGIFIVTTLKINYFDKIICNQYK